MSLSTYALVTVDELKEVLGIAASGQDAVLEGVIGRATSAIEAVLGRQLVTRGTLTEYHTVEGRTAALVALQFPITTITSVQEGIWSGGSWVPGVTLTAGSGYVADNAAGRLVKLGAFWQVGVDAVKFVYEAGFADSTAVPGDIKDVCLKLAGRKYSQIRRGGDFGAQTTTDAMGSVSRFLPSELLREEKEALSPWRSGNYAPTGRAA